MIYNHINHLLEQQQRNLADIDRLSGYHPENAKNPISKFWRRVCGKINRRQTVYNQSVERALIDIYNVETRLYQFANALQDTKDDADYHDFCITKEKRIFQVAATVRHGDAVGNDVLAIQNALKAAGFAVATFAETIDSKVQAKNLYPIMVMPDPREDDIILYHFAAEDYLAETLEKAKCKVVLRYHNVTPPQFFEKYDTTAMLYTKRGLEEIQKLKDRIDYGLVVSGFNKKDLQRMGYDCPIDVAPILVQFEDYKKTPNAEVIQKYDDGRTNILFVGRMAPNKKVEDVISAFAEYKKSYDSTARLFLVGGFNETDAYYRELNDHIRRLGVSDVIFSGHIGFDEILAYYTIADLFLLMSEHEGFCVPIAEAMFFDVPIVAYDSCAVPDTLGGSGLLVKEKDYPMIATRIHEILTDEEKKKTIIEGQRERLKDFDNAVIGEKIIGYMRKLLNE